MPLSKGKSDKAREANIQREIAAGKNPRQAVAIGYAQQRRNKERKPKAPLGKIGGWG